MSMFSTRNGLYERARQRFKVTDGIKLFSYPFYKQRRMDVQVRQWGNATGSWKVAGRNQLEWPGLSWAAESARAAAPPPTVL
jgi:hypothetical protein